MAHPNHGKKLKDSAAPVQNPTPSDVIATATPSGTWVEVASAHGLLAVAHGRGNTDKGITLAQRAAMARRQYWQEQYEAALARDDKEAAANALRFVQEYDAFLAILDC